ncbi:synaptosomal-associated protein 25-like [Clytia hemisphaerica]|uniref:synaptosomal-associated protein 25-like n=1 Tax=Clytia hemisphaerica TaxID=252671 RepID=UPI0034D64C28
MLSEDEQMRLELQRMQRHADVITDESLESTRRMVRLAEETQDTGIKTLVALDEQGEKLNRVEENLDQINADMREAEKNLTGLEKFCGLCICSCRRKKGFEDNEQYRKAYSNDSSDDKNHSFGSSSDRNASGAPSSGYIKKVTGDAREDEMDENIGQVAGIVDNLKMMAMDMGGELDKQNTQIERITDKATSNEVRLDRANERAERILRK